jgi:hypothetical protein
MSEMSVEEIIKAIVGSDPKTEEDVRKACESIGVSVVELREAMKVFIDAFNDLFASVRESLLPYKDANEALQAWAKEDEGGGE